MVRPGRLRCQPVRSQRRRGARVLLKSGHGAADYLLYGDQKAAGVIEAKPEGSTLTGVEVQSEKYSTGLPDNLPAHQRPLPFLYESTGAETQFTNRLDRNREAVWSSPSTPLKRLPGGSASPKRPGTDTRRMAEERRDYLSPYNLRQRLKVMPPLDPSGLWPVQERAIRNLEESLAAGGRGRWCRWPPEAARPSWPATRCTA